MKNCNSIRDRFSEYLDGTLTGVCMQQVAAHLERCAACSGEFSEWRQMQEALNDLGPAKAPDGLALRLRVAMSQELSRTPRQSLARFQVQWANSFAPFLFRASAGFASAVLLVGTAALLIGAFTSPITVEAGADASTSPRFRYSMTESNSLDDASASLREHERTGFHARPAVFISDDSAAPIVVEAYVNSEGRVYDYRIISGSNDPQSRARVETLLLFSVFEPARVFGQPVHGIALMTLSGISVQG
jgi:Putative zinc-finger